MVRCVLGLGSNLGNRLANLQDAVRRLGPDVEVRAVSPLYESDPVGPAGQPPYLNAVVIGVARGSPEDVLRLAKAVEWSLGRRPGPRWGPRPADIDILLMDGISIDSADLTIPHPRIPDRPFVVCPLADVMPDAVLSDGDTAARLAGIVDRASLRRIAGPEWIHDGTRFPPTVPPEPATP
jgi:2-amino-4-hydroxy-6-hydroxymethyldihydropteridine diphosphokinase